MLSLLAGLATALGALIALVLPGDENLGGLMSLSGGVMLTLALVDLLPAAWYYQGGAVALVSTLVGAALILAGALLPRRPHRHPLLHTGRMTALAMALHDLPEGIALAAGVASAPMGLALALAIGLHNLPEGAATAAPLRAAGVSRGRILLIALAVGLLTPLGTLLGLLWLGRLPHSLGWVMGLAAGAMLAVGVQQLRHAARLGGASAMRRLAWFVAGSLIALALARGLH
jgi:ZIP family zinc transporter